MAKPKPGEVQRRITFRLYPNAEQETLLFERLKLHAELYNAAIEERREAWRLEHRSVSYYDQQNQLPDLKDLRPDLIPLGSHALQETLRRVNRAFDAFFRRVKAGETPGFPRYKSWKRFSGWTWPDPAGWKYQPAAGDKNGRLFIRKLGAIPARGKARTPGTPVSCTISYRGGKWYASIVVNCVPVRKAGQQAVGMDLGVQRMATFSNEDRIENPQHFKQAWPVLRKAQRAVSRKHEKDSQRRRKAVAQVSKIYAKIANRRKDFLHKESAKVVTKYGYIATEHLDVKVMTVHGGRRKAGLNRCVLDVGMYTFNQMLRYKGRSWCLGGRSADA